MAGEPFTITHLARAPRDRVWDAWTRPEQMALWFGPKGSTTTILSGEIAAGSALHSRMDAPDGSSLWALFVYRELVPPSRIVWEHSFADAEGNITRSPFGGEWPRVLLATADFTEEAGGTRIRMRWAPLDATAEEEAEFEAAKPSMTGGWGSSLAALDAFLADHCR